MIKYSIVMRSVNANLFDINQAKSRIKAAEKAGQTPSSEDVALEATERRVRGTGTLTLAHSEEAQQHYQQRGRDALLLLHLQVPQPLRKVKNGRKD